MSSIASLLFLAPVLLMVGFVVVAKLRGPDADPELDELAVPAFEHELESIG